MSILRAIAARLRGGTPGFSRLEAAILDEAARQLGPVQAEKLRRRIDSINLVQRHDGGREVNAYAIRGGKPAFEDATRLIADGGEYKLATFTFRDGNQLLYAGCLWMVDGQFFSLEFDRPTEHALERLPTDLRLSVCI